MEGSASYCTKYGIADYLTKRHAVPRTFYCTYHPLPMSAGCPSTCLVAVGSSPGHSSKTGRFTVAHPAIFHEHVQEDDHLDDMKSNSIMSLNPAGAHFLGLDVEDAVGSKHEGHLNLWLTLQSSTSMFMKMITVRIQKRTQYESQLCGSSLPRP